MIGCRLVQVSGVSGGVVGLCGGEVMSRRDNEDLPKSDVFLR